MYMKKLFTFFSLWLLVGFAVLAAEQPAGYYKSAEGKKQKALLSQLCTIISANTKVISYSNLFEDAYPYTDAEDGYFIDMYSNVKYKVGDSRINKSYSRIGQSVNREHSFPQSWFKEQSPMKSDLFHVLPTDGYVNNQRSSYPYGECEGGTRLSNDGYYGKGRLGNCTAPGYTGKVWEPDDEYKGDFARTYFYMATRYNTKIGSWAGNGTAGNILDGTSYPVYKSWYLNLMLKWHRQDPVSEKEIKRNNAAYDLQRNRNPFIDHPELVEYIWGDKQDVAWYEDGSVDQPRILQPENGSSLEFSGNSDGFVGIHLDVKAQNLTEGITATVSGEGFFFTTEKYSGITSTYISAADAEQGSKLAVWFGIRRHGESQGTLTLTSGNLKTVVNLHGTCIDIMETNPAKDITPSSFKASWKAVEGVQSYTLYVEGKGGVRPPTPGNVTLLLDEDLSAGNTTWEQSGSTYKEKTALRLGTGSSMGAITSPSIDLQTSKGVLTVIADAAPYSKDSNVQMKISALNAQGAELDSKTVTLSYDAASYPVLLQGVADGACKVKIENLASKKRVLLTHVKVYAGNATSLSENAPLRAVAEVGDSLKREITGITDTWYTVRDLAKYGTFTYRVKAVYTDGTESDYSTSRNVTLKDAEVLTGDINADGKLDVTDVTALINHILSIATAPAERCDVNADGNVDVTDVTHLINMILAQ